MVVVAVEGREGAACRHWDTEQSRGYGCRGHVVCLAEHHTRGSAARRSLSSSMLLLL